MHESFLSLLATELDASPREVSQHLQELRRHIIEEATAEGEARIEGVGVFSFVDGELAFEAGEALIDVVNHRYAHLEPITITRDLPDFLVDASKEEDFAEKRIEKESSVEDSALKGDGDAEEEPETWNESLETEKTDHLGVGSTYEDAEFDIVDEEEAPEDETPQEETGNEPDPEDEPVAAERIEQPVEEESPEGAENTDEEVLSDISKIDLDESGEIVEPSRNEEEATEEPEAVEEVEPKPHAATQDTLSNKERRRQAEVEEMGRELVLPQSPFPYYSVLTREDLVDSSFIGAALTSDPPVAPVDRRDSFSKKPEPSEPREDRPPTPPRSQKQESNTTRNVVAVLALVAVLAVGGWLVVSQTNLFDDTASNGQATQQLAEEQQSPTADEEEDEGITDADPIEDESEVPLEDTDPDPPVEATPTPDGIEASAGMWTIVMASETTQAEAEQQLDDLYARFEDANLPLDVIESTVDGATRYRVAIGAFDSQDEATEYLNSLSDDLPEGSWLLQFDEDI